MVSWLIQTFYAGRPSVESMSLCSRLLVLVEKPQWIPRYLTKFLYSASILYAMAKTKWDLSLDRFSLADGPFVNSFGKHDMCKKNMFTTKWSR
jgi:hypothetical protein